MVHRDIKPQNIMLLDNGQLRMMDFGIARISRAENQLLSGKTMGSVHYISPEQAKGDETDCTSDIYSVGVMMYEMLSGQLPFDAEDAVEVAIKQISDQPEIRCTRSLRRCLLGTGGDHRKSHGEAAAEPVCFGAVKCWTRWTPMCRTRPSCSSINISQRMHPKRW